MSELALTQAEEEAYRLYLRDSFNYLLSPGPTISYLFHNGHPEERWEVHHNGRAFKQVKDDVRCLRGDFVFKCKTESGTVEVSFPGVPENYLPE